METLHKYICNSYLYRQPKSKLSLFISFLDNILNDPHIKSSNSYIIGDFNVDILKHKSSPIVSEFANVTLSPGFTPY